MKISTKQLLIGTSLLLIPGSSLVFGAYWIYKGIKKMRSKKQRSFREILDELSAEAEAEEAEAEKELK